MASIDVVLVIEDMNPATGFTSTQTVSDVVSASCTYKLGALEDVSWSGTGDVVDAINPDGMRIGPRKISISLDGGTAIDARMFSKATVVTDDTPLTLGESGVGSAEALGVTPIPRQTAQQITLGDALYGELGSVATSSGDLPLPSNLLPRFQGIGRTPLGLNPSNDPFYRYAINVASSIKNILVDIDVNRDYVLHAIDEVLALLPAEVDPSDAQYVIDSSDFGVADGTAQTISVGYKSDTALLSFLDPDSTDPGFPVLYGSTYQQDSGSLFDRMDANGGDTHHGAPEGGKMTGLVCVGKANGLDNEQDTLVVSFYVDAQHGGTYVWQASNRLLQISQSIGVNDQWYDQAANELYIAADSGVLARTGSLSVAATYTAVGTMHRRCSRVRVDTTLIGGAPGSVIYALAAGNQAGQNGILRYDGSGPLGGWTMLYPNDHLTDFCPFNGNLYCLASDNQNNVLYVDPAHPTAPRFLPVGGASSVAAIGLDPLVITGAIGGIAVRTALGSAGLYLISNNKFGMSPIGGGLSITNLSGQEEAVQVNQVRWHNPQGAEFSLNGLKCELLAATNRGLFVNGQAQAGGWQSVSGQGNLGDLNLLFVASDDKYDPGDGIFSWPVYAANESNLYVSYDGALHFVDVFAKPLDAGPAFYDFYYANHGQFPPLVKGALTIVYGGVNIVRSLDGLAHWVYTAQSSGGTSVGAAARTAEISQISTPSGVPEGQSSRQLLDVDVRFLKRAATTQTMLVIHSRFTDTDSTLRTLRPTHMAHVKATLQQCLTTVDPTNPSAPLSLQTWVDVDADYYVTEHSWTIDNTAPGVVHTRTTLSNILRTAAQDPASESADQLYQASRIQNYKTTGRR